MKKSMYILICIIGFIILSTIDYFLFTKLIRNINYELYLSLTGMPEILYIMLCIVFYDKIVIKK